MTKVELLSPAGDFEKLKIALLYGADAVYFGGQEFSLRANAKNFSLDEIKKATEYAHQRNKRVYVTVNIVFHESDLIGLKEYLQKLDEIGIDAIIASDIVVLELAKEIKATYELHLSTQSSVLNEGAATFYKELGVKRIVLAREASKEDIKQIKERTKLDLECFIHGAMCTSFSGKCVLSNYTTNRDANRGGCAQICRWQFNTTLSETPFSMTSKDLNMIPYIEDMIDIGVNSFKVEGRMRGIYYVATVIHTYRHLIDKIVSHTLQNKDVNYAKDILNRCANRESTPQFYNGLPTANEQYFLGRDEVSNQDFLGLVKGYDKENKMAIIEERNIFRLQDEIEFFGPNLETFSISLSKIYDEENTPIEVANHPGMIVKIPVPYPVSEFDMMRLKVFDKDDYV
ncbi:MAG: U32 family peptidase [Bacilli bacterium]|nr:U32 family peptidase [Bacilli bacterium]